MIKKKGFTFIITTLIIISLISLLLIVNARVIDNKEDSLEKINSNYAQEFQILINNGLNEEKIDQFNNSYKQHIKSQNYDSEICSIINDGNNLYISNYLGRNCDLFIDSDLNQTINNNSTIKIDNFINKTNIYLCSCTYNYRSIYYIKSQDSKNQIINKNF